MVATTGSGTAVVQCQGLTKVFRDFWMRTKAKAVDSIDFDIQTNEIFGLLGPNGSGKSTTIKMLLGLLKKTSGRLLVFGRPPSDVAVKKRIGFLPEESYLYRYLNSRETLEYYGKLFGLDRRVRRRRADELLEMVGLTQVAHRAIGEFSKGMTRRIGIAQALINDPEFLILDEPTSGLDPIGTRQVKDLLIDLRRRGKTILLSSHLLSDVEDVCDRMVMLYGGKIRAQGTAEELLADTERTVITAPRLRPETIARIEEVIREREGKGIDRVHAPRQRLEHLFLEMVDQARRESVETSGAQHGGTTAAFLKGEAEGVRGEDLVQALLREESGEKRARVAAPAGTGQGSGSAPAPAGPRQEILDDLVAGDEKPRAVERPVAPPSPPRDVDASIIDALLDDGGEEKRP